MENPEAFNFLFDILKDLNKSYSQNVMSTLGFILLTIGWIITSDKSRSFLSSSNSIRFSAIAVVGIIALIHSVVCIGAYCVTEAKFTQLVSLKYANVDYFQIYKLSGWHVSLNLVMNLALFGLLIFLIFKTKGSKSDRSN